MRPLRLLAAVTGSPRLLTAAPRTGTAPVHVPPDSLSGAGGTASAPGRPSSRTRLRAWAEL
ncbi:prenyltransferase, partial [Streptomyces sp. FT05W]